jgi:hypothetical protein
MKGNDFQGGMRKQYTTSNRLFLGHSFHSPGFVLIHPGRRPRTRFHNARSKSISWAEKPFNITSVFKPRSDWRILEQIGTQRRARLELRVLVMRDRCFHIDVSEGVHVYAFSRQQE